MLTIQVQPLIFAVGPLVLFTVVMIKWRNVSCQTRDYDDDDYDAVSYITDRGENQC